MPYKIRYEFNIKTLTVGNLIRCYEPYLNSQKHSDYIFACRKKAMYCTVYTL